MSAAFSPLLSQQREPEKRIISLPVDIPSEQGALIRDLR